MIIHEKGNKKDFPSQCNSCVRMEYCLKTGCIKSKDCKSKLITDKSYAESLAEIRRE